MTHPVTVELEATIGELAPGGDGVAICEIHGERRAVFVAGVASGERVALDVDTRRRPARARLLRVLAPSSARVSPPCAHVERCGGCDWMHLTPTSQVAEHANIVRRLLAGVTTIEPKSHAAVHDLRYRTRARLHVEAKRGRVAVGMFARRSHEPASVDTCVVLHPVVDRARGALASWLAGARGRGEASVSLAHPNATARRAVLELRWDGDLAPEVFGRLERAVLDGELGGARVFAGDVRLPANIGDPTPFITGPDGAPLRLGPGGFAQATEDGNALLANRVAALVDELPVGPLVELYAGAGNLTVLLARDREVTAIEHDHEACLAARENLAARGRFARVLEADVATFSIPKATRVLVLDPPREGARVVAEALAARRGRAPAVVYVACDPPTLARDVRTLVAAGYVVRALETFEMFPHTSHVETVVVLTKA